MSNLAEMIRKSRRTEISVGKMKFFGRRMTTAELYRTYNRQSEDCDVLIGYQLIDGWDGVREKDMFPGGSDALIDFDIDVFNEAIVDLPKIWKPIVKKIVEETEKHIKAGKENEKNLSAGTTKAS